MTAALDALSQAVQDMDSAGNTVDLPLELVHPDPDQPRQNAQENRQSLDELAESFRSTHGPLQPIHVEPHPHIEGHWQIVAGERRYLATAIAGFTTIRTIPLPRLTEEQRLTIQLIENDQREDLDLLSRAKSYERLLKISNKKPAELARQLGISHPAFTNTVRVLRASTLGKQAILDKLLTNAEAVRLFEKLSEGRKQKALDTARKSGEPISRPALERALREQAETSPDPADSLAEDPPPEQLTAPEPMPLSPENEELEPAVSLPPLALRYIRRLFELLDLPFPEDPDSAPAILIDFLVDRDR